MFSALKEQEEAGEDLNVCEEKSNPLSLPFTREVTTARSCVSRGTVVLGPPCPTLAENRRGGEEGEAVTEPLDARTALWAAVAP